MNYGAFMKTLKLSNGVLFALLLALSSYYSVFAGNSVTNQFLCEDSDDGGIWEGVGGSSTEGSCIYPPETGISQEACDEGESYVRHYDSNGNFSGDECVILNDPGTPATGEPYSHNSGQGGEAPIGLCTQAGGPWRCSYFNEGTCAVNCYIDPHLPAGAQHALPGGVITTLYVNISPDPGGSYSVCFENPDNESLTIYQYLGGVWVALATSTNNPICASSTGDGSFYLGS
jgi:hypothetical protein